LIVENILPHSEGAQPAPTILCSELCGRGLIVDFIPMTSNPLLLPVLNGAIAPTHQSNPHVENPSLLLFCVKDAPAITTLSLQLIVESLLLLRNFERPATMAVTNGNFFLKFIVESILEGAQFAPNFDRCRDLDISKLVVIYSKRSLHFRKDCGIFCEGE
jgi:hypothetical protein